MTFLLRPASLVWLVLMLATCTSTWWLSKEGVSTATATLLIMLIAAIKVRLILIHFMELGHAPIRWRLLFEGWNIACTAFILIMYLR
jgi:heme/copper-type cytochrome/quinol oxidase subunit 4